MTHVPLMSSLGGIASALKPPCAASIFDLAMLGIGRGVRRDQSKSANDGIEGEGARVPQVMRVVLSGEVSKSGGPR